MKWSYKFLMLILFTHVISILSIFSCYSFFTHSCLWTFLWVKACCTVFSVTVPWMNENYDFSESSSRPRIWLMDVFVYFISNLRRGRYNQTEALVRRFSYTIYERKGELLQRHWEYKRFFFLSVKTRVPQILYSRSTVLLKCSNFW